MGRSLAILVGIGMLFIDVGGLMAAFFTGDATGGLFWLVMLAVTLMALWHLLDLEWTGVEEEEDDAAGPMR